jgi:hypothetical protein
VKVQIFKARRARRQRQGAVLVEGLIVASLLGLLLACAVFFHALYTAKLSAMRNARADAWRTAVTGCAGGFASALLNSMNTITVLSEVEEAGMMDAPDWLIDLGRGVGENSPPAVQASPMLGGRSYTMRRRVSVACNDYADQAAGDSYIFNVFEVVRDMLVSR